MKTLRWFGLGAVCVTGLGLAGGHAAGQTVAWYRQFGTTGFDQSFGLAADGSGLYVGGVVIGALPGQVYQGSIDVFVRKYDFSGTELWTTQFGTPALDFLLGISVDSTGVYVAGRTDGTLPGQISAGGPDVFVRKYDASGNILWTRQSGTTSSDLANDVFADATGVYVAGQTGGTLPGQISAGGGDAFLRKYDSNGNEVWTRQFGTAGSTVAGDQARGVFVNAAGIFVGGVVEGSFPGFTSAGNEDAFVRKYDGNGNEVWTRQFGTAGFDAVDRISGDATALYVGGFVFGPLPGQVHAGGQDAFMRRYEFDGTESWTRQFGTPGGDVVDEVSVGANGLYVVGVVQGALPGQVFAGVVDAYVRKYDVNGTEQFTFQFGTSGPDTGRAVIVDGAGLFVAGSVGGSLFGQPSAGGIADAYVMKIVEPDTTPPETFITSAIDGNGAAVAGGGATLSTSIALSFSGTDNVGVTGFECSLDGAVFSPCSSPQSFSGLAVGTHTFQARALDAAGNVDPTPAALAWTVLTPQQAIGNLGGDIQALVDAGVLNSGQGNSLLSKLDAALQQVDSGNPQTAINQLQSFINAVQADVNSGKLTAAEGQTLIDAANAIIAALTP